MWIFSWNSISFQRYTVQQQQQKHMSRPQGGREDRQGADRPSRAAAAAQDEGTGRVVQGAEAPGLRVADAEDGQQDERSFDKARTSN